MSRIVPRCTLFARYDIDILAEGGCRATQSTPAKYPSSLSSGRKYVDLGTTLSRKRDRAGEMFPPQMEEE